MTELANDLKSTSTVVLAKADLTNGLRTKANLVARASRDLLLLDSAGAIKRQRDLVQTALAESETNFADLTRLSAGSNESDLVAQAGELRVKFTSTIGKYLEKIDQGATDDARSILLIELRPVLNKYEEVLQALSTSISSNARLRSEAGEAKARTVSQITILLALVAAALSSFVGWAIARSITTPARTACELAAQIARGDLSHEVIPEGKDEMADLLNAMHEMQVKLNEVVSDVAVNARQIARSVAEVDSGNADLAARTERSSVDLQSTTADMNQINDTIKESSSSFRSAAEVAERTRQIAEAGGGSVQTLVLTMGEIAASSRKIQDIIGLIDGIAFQTNILALNAAVEAARAGDQGRGFAVVASEVRALASRSAEAAREIKTLISESSEKIDNGAQMAEGTGGKISQVISEVASLHRLIGEIAQSADAQAERVSTVSQRMGDLEQSTQQNSALVEELSASTESLGGNATRLMESVSFFQSNHHAEALTAA